MATTTTPPPAATTSQLDIALAKASTVLSPDEVRLLGETVAIALQAADSDGDGLPDAKGIAALWHKDGQFSKTALFAVLGNFIVLVNYALQSWLAGAAIDLGFVAFTVPAFNVGDAVAVMGVLNATYLGGNVINGVNKSKEAAATIAADA